jgi:hypothetical protein
MIRVLPEEPSYARFHPVTKEITNKINNLTKQLSGIVRFRMPESVYNAGTIVGIFIGK